MLFFRVQKRQRKKRTEKRNKKKRGYLPDNLFFGYWLYDRLILIISQTSVTLIKTGLCELHLKSVSIVFVLSTIVFGEVMNPSIT